MWAKRFSQAREARETSASERFREARIFRRKSASNRGGAEKGSGIAPLVNGLYRCLCRNYFRRMFFGTERMSGIPDKLHRARGIYDLCGNLFRILIKVSNYIRNAGLGPWKRARTQKG